MPSEWTHRGSGREADQGDRSLKPGTPPGGLRAERDKLVRDIDELRDRYTKLETEFSDTSLALVSPHLLRERSMS